MRKLRLVWAMAFSAVATACGEDASPDAVVEDGRESGAASEVQMTLESGMRRILARAASIDSVLQPLPLLTPAQESSLRRYLNAQQLQRARALGVGRPAGDELEALVREGRLVELNPSTELWVVGDLDVSSALVTPDARAMLTDLGERFHARLDEMGLPPFRVEVSSALRTSADQSELRRVNPNAASGVSTHEFGTTLDVLYSRFAAPADLAGWLEDGTSGWEAEHLEQVARLAGDRIGGQRALELKAILGEVLLELQNEGRVMVTLERRQPVYHMTVATRY